MSKTGYPSKRGMSIDPNDKGADDNIFLSFGHKQKHEGKTEGASARDVESMKQAYLK